MNNSTNFEEWFKKISPKLGVREISYKKIIKFLDSQPTPIIIVETGCLRKEDNFLDGQSTLIFDKYTLSRGNGSKVYTVDISPKSTEICKKVVSDNVDIVTEDSVRHLNNLVKIFIEKSIKPTMFFLDSFDVDWRYPYPSAAHHLKELTAIQKILDKNTLVVVDDAPAIGHLERSEANLNKDWKVIDSFSPTIGGKGFLVHEYACHVKAKVLFSHYQTAWVGFNQ